MISTHFLYDSQVAIEKKSIFQKDKGNSAYIRKQHERWHITLSLHLMLGIEAVPLKIDQFFLPHCRLKYQPRCCRMEARSYSLDKILPSTLTWGTPALYRI